MNTINFREIQDKLTAVASTGDTGNLTPGAVHARAAVNYGSVHPSRERRSGRRGGQGNWHSNNVVVSRYSGDEVSDTSPIVTRSVLVLAVNFRELVSGAIPSF